MHPCTDAIVIADSDAVTAEPYTAGEVRLLKRSGRQVEVIPPRGHVFVLGPTGLFCSRCGEMRAL